jgi:hypothetical protein
MEILTISKISGESLVLEIPSDISEIKLRAKLDFDFGHQSLLNYLSDVSEEKPFNSGYYLYLLCKVLNDFFVSQGQEVDLNDFIEIDTASLLDDNMELLPEVIERHFESYKDVGNFADPDTVEPTLTAIFDHITGIIGRYKFDYSLLNNDLSFEYKGELYKVFRRTVDNVYGVTFGSVSVGELTEAFEISRQLNKNYSTETASTVLTEMLGVLSVIAKKEGEKLPLDDVEKFIEVRSKHFLDIPFKQAADVFFYLTPSLSTLLHEKTLNTFSNHLNDLLQEK